MAWTITDLSLLETAIAQGATRVKYADKEVEYRSLTDMLRLREQIKLELGITTKANNGRKIGIYNKGL
jgi:hypothetical protein